MNRVLVNWLILLSFFPLVLSCGKGQQSSFISFQQQAIQWAEQRIGQQDLSTCLDSAYWIGICWNIYQLSKDSAFRIEAEKYLEPLYPIMEDTSLNANKAFRAYIAFAKGFEATGSVCYRHKVWDLADRLMTDTACITPFTVETLLWGTANQGCHCFKEAAIDWGIHQLKYKDVLPEISRGLGIIYLYTADTTYLQAFEEKKYELEDAIDSLQQVSVNLRIDTLNSTTHFSDEAIGVLQNMPLNKYTSLQKAYYYTELLLVLLTNQ